MNREEIEIAVLPDGRVEYTIRGIKGPTCDSLSAVLEQIGRVEHQERTSDYYAQEPDTHIHVGNDS